MRKTAGGRVYRSESEKRRIVEGYERSGLSQERFCKERGVSLSNLARWRVKAKAGQADRELEMVKPQFLEIGAEPSNCWDIEVNFGGGVVLRMRR